MNKNDEENLCAQSFLSLLRTVKTLRSQNGCPWDKDQTPESLRRDLMEETFEAIDAITQNDTLHIREELGDVMFNLLLTAYMYEQNGDFKLSEIFDEVNEKLIRRHPHVFKNEGEKITTGEVLTQWDKIKDDVEGRKTDSVLDQVPQGFPPLLKAFKMVKKAAKKNFDWQSPSQFLGKISEEISEVQEAARKVQELKKLPSDEPFTLSGGNEALNDAQLHLEEEIGDFFLASVNYARYLGVDPTLALDRANRKFYKRFSYIEKKMAERGIPFSKEKLSAMMNIWNEAKQNESK